MNNGGNGYMTEQNNQSVLSSEQLKLSQVLEQNNQILKQNNQLIVNQNELIKAIKQLVQINTNQSHHIQELICLITDESKDEDQHQSLDD